MNKPNDIDKLTDMVRDAVAEYSCLSYDDTFTVKLCITVDGGWVSVSVDNDNENEN